ncbi:hypothetical protein AMEX_G14358 [Astyanax mexicanus]|uniref:Uncharacterized protein n=1 Tax=Astyanax mexicanus TaxID=7994 RepID=A0A8T2LRJ7_ASTMX|nr:hypothetical protein AMEX_G14358 [Astyanax mexicanus]
MCAVKNYAPIFFATLDSQTAKAKRRDALEVPLNQHASGASVFGGYQSSWGMILLPSLKHPLTRTAGLQ